MPAASEVSDLLVLGMNEDDSRARRHAGAPAELIKAGRNQRDNGNQHTKPPQLIRHICPPVLVLNIFLVRS
jgi:hypothetical protein